MSQLPNVRGIVQKTGRKHRNSGRATESRTKRESDHIGRVKELPCAVCAAAGPSHAHHIMEGRTPNRRSPDWLTIPLCDPCHQGPNGIHGDKRLWSIYRITEQDALNDTLEALYG